MTEVHQTGLMLMETSAAAFLTTLNQEGQPETRAMLNLRNPSKFPGLRERFKPHTEDFLLYFTTNTSSGKVRQITQNPNVCVYYCLPDAWQGLLLTGKMEIVTDSLEKESLWQAGWELYYPKGPSDQDYAILRLVPKTGKLYGQMQVRTLSWES